MRALVLSGGGAKGAYEAGVVHALVRDRNEQFDIVCGTSIGAINAAFVAQDKIEELVDVWHGISESELIRPLPSVDALRHAYLHLVGALHGDGGPLGKLSNLGFAGLDLQRIGPLRDLAAITGALVPDGARKLLADHLDFARLDRILLTSATNITMRRQETFHAFPASYASARADFLAARPDAVPIDARIFAECVRASGAIPGAFGPVNLAVGANAYDYVDGGVTNNTPIGQAIDAGATDVTIVYVDPLGGLTEPRPPRNLAAILLGCFSLMQQCILDLDYETAMRVNDGIDAGGASGKRRVAIRAFRPDRALEPGIIDFDEQELIDEAFARGVDDVRRYPSGTPASTPPVKERTAVMRGSETGPAPEPAA